MEVRTECFDEFGHIQHITIRPSRSSAEQHFADCGCFRANFVVIQLIPTVEITGFTRFRK